MACGAQARDLSVVSVTAPSFAEGCDSVITIQPPTSVPQVCIEAVSVSIHDGLSISRSNVKVMLSLGLGGPRARRRPLAIPTGRSRAFNQTEYSEVETLPMIMPGQTRRLTFAIDWPYVAVGSHAPIYIAIGSGPNVAYKVSALGAP